VFTRVFKALFSKGRAKTYIAVSLLVGGHVV
jgi:hypothetical protein